MHPVDAYALQGYERNLLGRVQTRIPSHASETIDKDGVTIDFGKQGVEVEHEDLAKYCGGELQFNESWNALIPGFCPESQRTMDSLKGGLVWLIENLLKLQPGRR